MCRAIRTANKGRKMNRCDSIMTQRRTRLISGKAGTKPGCWRDCFAQRSTASVGGIEQSAMMTKSVILAWNQGLLI
ncbi:hypothetical protein G6F68_020817 [Rhizopus microsporus]|nr:hypothetical protein G6F68_020817 [Rhizopus microsporus]